MTAVERKREDVRGWVEWLAAQRARWGENHRPEVPRATHDLVIQIGNGGVRVPAVFSSDGWRMIYAGGPGGWFGQAAILAEKVGGAEGTWVSRVRDELGVEWPIRVRSEARDGQWVPVRDGNIGVARPAVRRQPEARGRGRGEGGRRW